MTTDSNAPIALSTKAKVPGDNISDDVMKEVARRLDATVKISASDSDIVGTAGEPTDKTKVWWPINTTDGTRIGVPKVWSPSQNAWVDIGSQNIPKVPRTIIGSKAFVAGASTPQVTFDPFGHTAYHVSLTPYYGGGVAPGTITNLALLYANKQDGSFTIDARGIPTGGMNVEYLITEILS